MNIYIICTLWTPFQPERDCKFHTEGLSKFHSNNLFGNWAWSEHTAHMIKYNSLNYIKLSFFSETIHFLTWNLSLNWTVGTKRPKFLVKISVVQHNVTFISKWNWIGDRFEIPNGLKSLKPKFKNFKIFISVEKRRNCYVIVDFWEPEEPRM